MAELPLYFKLPPLILLLASKPLTTLTRPSTNLWETIHMTERTKNLSYAKPNKAFRKKVHSVTLPWPSQENKNRSIAWKLNHRLHHHESIQNPTSIKEKARKTQLPFAPWIVVWRSVLCNGPGPSSLERDVGEGENPVEFGPCCSTRRCLDIQWRRKHAVDKIQFTSSGSSL